MPAYNRVIFVCTDNICMSPMAAAVMKNIKRDEWISVESRGLVVLFPEPVSAKAAMVMRNHGYVLDAGTAKRLEDADFSENTLVLTMSREEKHKILREYHNVNNLYTIMEFIGENGDIIDPYGGDNDVYEMFYTSICDKIEQVEHKIHDINTKEDLK